MSKRKRVVLFGDNVRKRTKALLAEGRTYKDIRAVLAAEGIDPAPSEGWIASVVRGKDGPEPVPEPEPRPEPVRPRRPPPVVPEGATLQERSLIHLEYQAQELLEALADARQSGNMQAVGSVSRALNATLAELRKTLPRDMAEDPDDVIGGAAIREAAERGRLRLGELLGRVVQGWPVCPVCGRPRRPIGGG